MISGHLRKSQKNQYQWIRSKKISCNWGKNFRLFQKNKVLEPTEAMRISLITGEPLSATMSIALFWLSQRFIYFLFFLLQFYS